MSSRTTAEELDDFISNGINFYELLGLQQQGSSTVSEREVRRSYRKQALIYHPDKNPSEEARAKFELISKALEILTHPDLKEEYDRKLTVISQTKVRNEALSKNLQDLRINLQQNEQRHKDLIANNKKRAAKVELLKLDGAKRRALKEQQLKARSQGTKSSSLNNTREYKLKYSSEPPYIKLKWKLKKEVPDIFANGVISQLMQIFGDILDMKKCPQGGSKLNQDARYDYCLIKYKDFDSFHRALKHDYKRTSDIWDSLGLRKLSSLLRSVEVFNEHDDDNDNEIYFEDYFDQVIAKMNNV